MTLAQNKCLGCQCSSTCASRGLGVLCPLEGEARPAYRKPLGDLTDQLTPERIILAIVGLILLFQFGRTLFGSVRESRRRARRRRQLAALERIDEQRAKVQRRYGEA